MHQKQNERQIGTDRHTDRHKNIQEKQPYIQEEKNITNITSPSEYNICERTNDP
jgi:hypothetical protein